MIGIMDILDSLRNRVMGQQQIISPIPNDLLSERNRVTPQAANKQPRPSPAAYQQEQQTLPSPDMYRQTLLEGFGNYGRGEPVPVSENVDDFTKILALAQTDPRYAIFKQYPYLLPAVSLQETSGGRNITYENNPLNWGIRPQQQGIFNPQNFSEVIDKAASGIAYRTPAAGYQSFRDTGNLEEFVNTYAPPSENDAARYLKQLKDFMETFEQIQKRKNKKS